MKIAVFGTGAIGGFYGALLAKAGHEVHFIARGKNLEALQKNGLHMSSAAGIAEVSLPEVRCTSDPRSIGQVDLTLLCVKSYDTASLVEPLASLMGEASSVLSVQNGVDNAEILAERLGPERVVAASAFVNVSLQAPGRISHLYGGQLVIGQADPTSEDGADNGSPGDLYRPDQIAEVLSHAGITVEVSRGIRKVLWMKLVWNASFNALTCLTGATIREVLALPEARHLAEEAMREVAVVGKAQGLEVSEQEIQNMLEHAARMGDAPTSMLTDRKMGRRLEHEAISGIVVRRGEEHGIPTPINQILYAMLKSVDAHGRELAERGAV